MRLDSQVGVEISQDNILTPATPVETLSRKKLPPAIFRSKARPGFPSIVTAVLTSTELAIKVPGLAAHVEIVG